VICSLAHLKLLVRDFCEHYHADRPHQSPGNQPILESTEKGTGEIKVKDRLGSFLKHNYRKAPEEPGGQFVITSPSREKYWTGAVMPKPGCFRRSRRIHIARRLTFCPIRSVFDVVDPMFARILPSKPAPTMLWDTTSKTNLRSFLLIPSFDR